MEQLESELQQKTEVYELVQQDKNEEDKRLADDLSNLDSNIEKLV